MKNVWILLQSLFCLLDPAAASFLSDDEAMATHIKSSARNDNTRAVPMLDGGDLMVTGEEEKNVKQDSKCDSQQSPSNGSYVTHRTSYDKSA